MSAASWWHILVEKESSVEWGCSLVALFFQSQSWCPELGANLLQKNSTKIFRCCKNAQLQSFDFTMYNVYLLTYSRGEFCVDLLFLFMGYSPSLIVSWVGVLSSVVAGFWGWSLMLGGVCSCDVIYPPLAGQHHDNPQYIFGDTYLRALTQYPLIKAKALIYNKENSILGWGRVKISQVTLFVKREGTVVTLSLTPRLRITFTLTSKKVCNIAEQNKVGCPF